MILYVILALAAFAVARLQSSEDGLKYLEKYSKQRGVVKLPSGLLYKSKGKIKGYVAKKDVPDISPNSTTTCYVHYKGSTIEGVVFDYSRKRGDNPTKFRPADVIKGWTEALQLMKRGDVWELVVPAELAYGDRQVGEHITPGSVLIFEVELIDFETKPSRGWLMIPKSLTDVPIAVWIFLAYLFYVTVFSSAGGKKGNIQWVPVKRARGEGVNKMVYLDVFIGSGEIKPSRIEIELFNAICPKTCSNFRALCTGELGNSKQSGKPLHFKNSNFHRIIPGFMAQGGDFTRGNGTGGESIYGDKFEDEFELGGVMHSEPYLLSMANAGPDTNGSQFFITFKATPHLNGKHVVFGIVTSGQETIRKMESAGTDSGAPKAPVRIVGCGEIIRSGTSSPARSVTSDTSKRPKNQANKKID